MTEQFIMRADNNYRELDTYLIQNQVQHIFLVCGRSIQSMNLNQYFKELFNKLGISVVRFSDFAPNPTYESVKKGVELFRSNPCDLIVAVGGGSAMDVAKCIKLYSNMDVSRNYLEQKIVPTAIKLLAVPTTAGTGSEATRFAVIYYKGEKQSVSDSSCIPSAVLFDASVLRSLPEYQRKVTMLDALCHAIESFWSVNSTEKSKMYSKHAIQLILSSMDSYLANDEGGNNKMLEAANIAGKAINIAQTTAGHAMSYKLTGLYGIAHGHAAALCVAELWEYMSMNMDYCIDGRGRDYQEKMFRELAATFGCRTIAESIKYFKNILTKLALPIPETKEEDYDILKHSVNQERLKNHPVELTEDTIDMLYHRILS